MGRRPPRAQLSLFKRQPAEVLPDGSEEITAEHLRQEALTFVYRLLFCFYAEARGGELGILPIDDETYRLGYSLEALRDLELVPLNPETEVGGYFQEHLFRLFRMIHDGFNCARSEPRRHEMSHEDTKSTKMSTKISRSRLSALVSPWFNSSAAPSEAEQLSA